MSPPCAQLYPLCGCVRGASPPCETCSRAATNAYKQDTFMGAKCTCLGKCRSSTECEAPSTHPACADPTCTRCKFRFLNTIGKKCNCKHCKSFPAPPRGGRRHHHLPLLAAGTIDQSKNNVGGGGGTKRPRPTDADSEDWREQVCQLNLNLSLGASA